MLLLRVNEDRLKQVIARNITRQRKAFGLTQAGLADKLNYTDKSVSKWERGESIPDALVLKQLADLFYLKVDDLLTDNDANDTTITDVTPSINPYIKHKKVTVPILSVLLNFFVATVMYYFFVMFHTPMENAWYIYVLAMCTSSITLIVFSAKWWKPCFTAIFTSTLTWSTVLFLYLVSAMWNKHAWLLFAIAGMFQILIIVWFVFKRPRVS